MSEHRPWSGIALGGVVLAFVGWAGKELLEHDRAIERYETRFQTVVEESIREQLRDIWRHIEELVRESERRRKQWL